MPFEREAAGRQYRNRFSRTNRPIEGDAEQLGIAGEMAFAHVLGRDDHDPGSRKRTPGFQFHEQGFRIKVLTSRTPGHLLVKQGKVAADIYVLAGCAGDPDPANVFWCGWASKSIVLAHDPKVMSHKGDYTLPSHAVPRDALEPMTTLLRLLGIPLERIHPAFTQADPEPAGDPPITNGRLF